MLSFFFLWVFSGEWKQMVSQGVLVSTHGLNSDMLFLKKTTHGTESWTKRGLHVGPKTGGVIKVSSIVEIIVWKQTTPGLSGNTSKAIYIFQHWHTCGARWHLFVRPFCCQEVREVHCESFDWFVNVMQPCVMLTVFFCCIIVLVPEQSCFWSWPHFH